MPIRVTRREKEVNQTTDNNGAGEGDGLTVRQVNGNIIISNGCGWSVTVEGNQATVYTDQGEIKVTTEN